MNKGRPAGTIEGLIDGLRFELDGVANAAVERPPLTGTAGIRRLSARLNYAALYSALADHWMDCLHHGWDVVIGSHEPVIGPFGEWERASDHAVGAYRSEMLLMEMAGRASQLFAPEGIGKLNGVVRGRSNHDYAIREADDEQALQVFVSRLIVMEPDLLPLMNVVVDAATGLTLGKVLDVWGSLVPLAADIATRVPLHDTIVSMDQVEQFAPVQDAVQICRQISKVVGTSIPQSRAALHLLTWRGARDDVWHRPLIPLDEESFVIVLTALSSLDLRRFVEHVLVTSGFDMSTKGNPFEQAVRDKVANWIDENRLLRGGAGALRSPTRPSDRSVGDIDLIAWIGDTVLVGETKCLVRPATSHDWFRYRDRLEEAAVQVKRKVAWLEQNPEWSRATIGVERTRISIVPCIVTNSAALACSSVGGIPVVDQWILYRYFGAGYGEMYTSLDGRATEMPFYQTASEAAECMRSYMENPPHLAQYRRSIEADVTHLPDFAGNGGLFHIAEPVVRVGVPDSTAAQMAFEALRR